MCLCAALEMIFFGFNRITFEVWSWCRRKIFPKEEDFERGGRFEFKASASFMGGHTFWSQNQIIKIPLKWKINLGRIYQNPGSSSYDSGASTSRLCARAAGDSNLKRQLFVCGSLDTTSQVLVPTHPSHQPPLACTFNDFGQAAPKTPFSPPNATLAYTIHTRVPLKMTFSWRA